MKRQIKNLRSCLANYYIVDQLNKKKRNKDKKEWKINRIVLIGLDLKDTFSRCPSESLVDVEGSVIGNFESMQTKQLQFLVNLGEK